MKKSPEERFEKELLQALRGPMPASERNAARSRVSRRLQVTLSHLEVGAAAALPLLLEAPQVAATQSAAGLAVSSKVLAATTSGVGGAAATGTAAAGASLAAAAAHPLGMLVTAFALGAGAGGAAFVALSPAAPKVEPGAHASSMASLAPRSLAPRPASKASSRPAFEPGRGTPSSAAATPVTESSVRRESPPPGAGKEALRAVSSGATRRNQAGSEPLEEPRVDTLTAQQALLDRARAALARGQGREALTALSEHSRVHPSSELAEEREALTIKALISSGDFASARMRAVDFGARYPRSLFLSSIRAALPNP